MGSPNESIPPMAFHTMEVEAVCDFFKVEPLKGRSTAEAVAYQQRYGYNELDQGEQKPFWHLLLEQFRDLLARILLGAAIVSFALAVISGDAHGKEGITAFVEPFVILLILIANAFVSAWQESSAEKSLEALKKLQPDLAKVLRDGSWRILKAREVVPGDIFEVKAGDRVPADGRVIQLLTMSLRADQSQLTGEPQTVPKERAALPAEEGWADCEVQSKFNMLFASTTVANGTGVAVVTAIGMRTEIGRIQAAVQQAGAEEEATPLQEKLDEFGELLSKVIGVVCALVWIINFRNFSEPSHGGFLRGCVYYFKTAVALAVAAIPEGLTAVITTCLALGTRKMAQRNAIVRHLPSVETLGCTTVICSDKTGTLTTNEMSVVKFALLDAKKDLRKFEVSGTLFSRVGIARECNTKKPFSVGAGDKAVHFFARCAVLCNEATLTNATNDPSGEGRFERQGEPTEAALKVLIEKLGCPDPELSKNYFQQKAPGSGVPKLTRRRSTYFPLSQQEDEVELGGQLVELAETVLGGGSRAAEAEVFGRYWCRGISRLALFEFSRDRKSMSVLCRAAEGAPDPAGGRKNFLLAKGAPESILDRCSMMMLPDGSQLPMTHDTKSEILEEVELMAKDALRTLALAVRFDLDEFDEYDGPQHFMHKKLMDIEDPTTLETELVFLGLVGLQDPPRPEVANAIRSCHLAGIRVIMITGDNKKTAEAIALKTGIIKGGSNDPDFLKEVSFTGREFDVLSDSEKLRVLSSPHGLIFSRTEPRHKQQIVKHLRALGEITAMTGDGVNDAPALKQADIGISMGVVGTEVAKEASDMILADDNFSTIVVAIEEGRSIYNNMKAFIRYLISSNLGEVVSIFLTAALRIPEGLAPVQLLWVNLVTDGFPATALGFNPPDVNVMQRPPRNREEPLISGWVFFRYLIIGIYVGFATVGIFVCWYIFGVGSSSDNHTKVSFWQLSHYNQCHQWENFTVLPVFGMDPKDPCSYFTTGKIKASTLSLTVLVVIEMFNAFNALSEDGSLLQLPPWANLWLVLAVAGSIIVHCFILYLPSLAAIFGVVPLSLVDWIWVVLWSLPVILIDETLKTFARRRAAKMELLKDDAVPSTKKPKKLQ